MAIADKFGMVRSQATPPTPGLIPSAVAGLSVKEFSGHSTFKSVFTLKNMVIASIYTGGANGSQGNQPIYTFPKGVIQLLGVAYNLATLAGSGGLIDAALLVGSIGSAPADVAEATLLGTEADFIPSTVGTLVARVGALKGNSIAPAAPFDGSVTALIAYLNIAAPQASESANDTITLNGKITILWSNLTS